MTNCQQLEVGQTILIRTPGRYGRVTHGHAEITRVAKWATCAMLTGVDHTGENTYEIYRFNPRTHESHPERVSSRGVGPTIIRIED